MDRPAIKKVLGIINELLPPLRRDSPQLRHRAEAGEALGPIAPNTRRVLNGRGAVGELVARRCRFRRIAKIANSAKIPIRPDECS